MIADERRPGRRIATGRRRTAGGSGFALPKHRRHDDGDERHRQAGRQDHQQQPLELCPAQRPPSLLHGQCASDRLPAEVIPEDVLAFLINYEDQHTRLIRQDVL